MHVFVKAVITGFGLALGAAIYRKVARELGIDDKGGVGVGSTPVPGEPLTTGR